MWKKSSYLRKVKTMELRRTKHPVYSGAVKQLQMFLNEYNFGDLKEDGLFGLDTHIAVMGFQEKKGLQPDGIVGRDTWSAICKYRRVGVKLRNLFRKVLRTKEPVPGLPVAPRYWSMSESRRYALLGRSEGEVRANLAPVSFKGRTFKMHVLVATRVQAALDRYREWEITNDVDYHVDYLDAFCWRMQRGSRRRRSNHSWASAFDINPNKNPMGRRLITDLPPMFIKCMVESGARWGGDYLRRKDAMHFEW
jgi:hypothetical protein